MPIYKQRAGFITCPILNSYFLNAIETWECSFLSLTVEKMVEVEKISHFRKWFGIELNIRDLFLDHPGIFYLSTKGKRHTVFLREAYERGCLIQPNPVYDARRKLLDLVILGRRGLGANGAKPTEMDGANKFIGENES